MHHYEFDGNRWHYIQDTTTTKLERFLIYFLFIFALTMAVLASLVELTSVTSTF